jgi:hypothetical protein
VVTGNASVWDGYSSSNLFTFEERVVTILSWIQAAMRGIGHICTTCILETQTYVLIMRSLHSGVLTSKRRKETHDYMGEMSVPNIRAYMPDPSHRCLNPTQDRHDAFFELMATSIVSELMYFYIPLGLVSMKVASSLL